MAERLNGHSDFVVKGCPIADGRGGCITTCAGNWPGTKITTEAMTEAVLSRRINPNKLGCGILVDNAKHGLERLNHNGNGTEET